METNKQDHDKDKNDFSNLKIFSKLALLISVPGIIMLVIGFLTNDDEGYITMAIGAFGWLFLFVSICLMLAALISEGLFYRKSAPIKMISTVIFTAILWQTIKHYSYII